MNSSNFSDAIKLTGLSARGYHGVLPAERQEGQVFIADVSLYLAAGTATAAAGSDYLADTVDYAAVAKAVVAVIEGESVNLLETLAARIADAVLTFAGVREVEVTVHKPQAPLEVAFTDVALTLVRSQLSSASADPVAPVRADAESNLLGALPTASAARADELELPAPAPTTAAAAPALKVGLPDLNPVPDFPEVPLPAVPPAAAPSLAALPEVHTEPDPLPEAEPTAPVAAAATELAPAAPLEAEPAAEPAVGSEVAPAAAEAPVEADVADVLAQAPSHPVQAVLALGGNVGAVVVALRQAVQALSHTDGIEVNAVAPLARTAAVVEPHAAAQPDYLNTVVLLTTTLSPRQLLQVCQDLEAAAGRVRTQPKGPRTLDVDVITYEGVTSTDSSLTLPHPAASGRAFVLVPWAQVDPFAELAQQSVAALAEQAGDRDGVRWLALDWIESDNLPALPTGQYIAPLAPDAAESSEGAASETEAEASAASEPEAQADLAAPVAAALPEQSVAPAAESLAEPVEADEASASTDAPELAAASAPAQPAAPAAPAQELEPEPEVQAESGQETSPAASPAAADSAAAQPASAPATVAPATPAPAPTAADSPVPVDDHEWVAPPKWADVIGAQKGQDS